MEEHKSTREDHSTPKNEGEESSASWGRRAERWLVLYDENFTSGNYADYKQEENLITEVWKQWLEPKGQLDSRKDT